MIFFDHKSDFCIYTYMSGRNGFGKTDEGKMTAFTFRNVQRGVQKHLRQRRINAPLWSEHHVTAGNVHPFLNNMSLLHIFRDIQLDVTVDRPICPFR